jgi:phosphoribosylformylglycinamidine (FGAM) synthase-like enzyme
VVNCLNFGNPEHPEVMWQLSESIDGMAEACRALDLPVIGGNVSLYNESGGADIDPTPVLGLLGLVDAVRVRPPGLAWSAGDTIVVLGPALDPSLSLEGTRWAAERRGHRGGSLPPLDFTAHDTACRFVAGLVASQVGGAPGPVRAVHDISGGGLAVALGEMAAESSLGCQVDLTGAATLFAEGPSRFVVASDEPDALCAQAEAAGVEATVLGRVGGERLVLGDLVDLPVDALRDAYLGSLQRALGEV